jgi:hypothetical protein
MRNERKGKGLFLFWKHYKTMWVTGCLYSLCLADTEGFVAVAVEM